MQTVSVGLWKEDGPEVLLSFVNERDKRPKWPMVYIGLVRVDVEVHTIISKGEEDSIDWVQRTLALVFPQLNFHWERIDSLNEETVNLWGLAPLLPET